MKEKCDANSHLVATNNNLYKLGGGHYFCSSIFNDLIQCLNIVLENLETPSFNFFAYIVLNIDCSKCYQDLHQIGLLNVTNLMWQYILF